MALGICFGITAMIAILYFFISATEAATYTNERLKNILDFVITCGGLCRDMVKESQEKRAFDQINFMVALKF